MPKRNRKKLIAAAVAVLLIGIGTAAYHALTSPKRVLRLVEGRLREVLPCPVSVGSARFSLFDGLELGDLRVGPLGAGGVEPMDGPEAVIGSTRNGSPGAALRCDSLQLTHRTFALLLGRFEVERVVADRAVLDVAGDFKTAFRSLRTLGERVPPDSFESLPTWPAIEIRDSELRLLAVDRSADANAETLSCTIRGMPLDDPGAGYEFAWQTSAGEAGITELDLRRLRLRSVRGGSPWVSIGAGLAAFSPYKGAVQEWGTLLGATGRVRAADFDLALVASETMQESVALEVRDGFLAVPAGPDESDVLPHERYLRVDGLTAEVRLATGEVRVGASGSLRGSPAEMVVSVPGGLRAMKAGDHFGFSMDLSVRELAIPKYGPEASPADQRVVQASDTIARLVDDLRPAGRVDVSVTVARPAVEAGAATPAAGREPGSLPSREPARTRLERVLVRARDASAVPAAFPYPLGEITGEVEVRRDGVDIRTVCGRRGEGTVCVNGRFDGLGRDAPAELVITGRDIPIDDQLYAALGPEYDAVREMFDPKGRIDVRTVRTRPAAAPSRTEPQPEMADAAPPPWHSHTVVRPQSVSARYAELPYDMDAIGGEIRLDGDRLAVDLSGQTGDAEITAAGGVTVGPSGARDLSLRVSARGLPIDERLLSTCPERVRPRLADLHAAGTINAELDVSGLNDAGPVVSRAEVELVDARMRPEAFPIPISQLSGRLIVEGERIELKGLAGRYRDGELTLDGVLTEPLTETDGRIGEQSLRLSAGHLDLDDTFVAAAPPALREVLSTWRVTGPISASLVVNRPPSSPGEPAEAEYEAEIRLANVAVRHAAVPVPFEKVSGVVRIDNATIQSEGLSGLFGNAPVGVELRLQMSGGLEHGFATVTATNVPIDENLLAAFPEPAARKLRRLGLAGRVDVSLDALRLSRVEPGGGLEWWASGMLGLKGVSVPGTDLHGATGQMTLAGALYDPKDGTWLDGELRLDRIAVLDRELTFVHSPWSFVRSTNGIGELSIDRLNARLYGGDFSGRAAVRFTPGTAEFDLTSIVQGMQLGPFLNAGRDADLPPVDVTGRVIANLFLSGELGEPATLRGGGRFSVEEGYLYELPLILAILNVLELNLRPAEAFDEASGDFYIVGRIISLTDIAIRGGMLALIGSGTLTLPDFAADLRLINVPDRWWARLPLLAEVMQGAVRELIQVRVTGPIRQPTVRTAPIPRVTDELRSLFQRRDRRRPIAPGRR